MSSFSGIATADRALCYDQVSGDALGARSPWPRARADVLRASASSVVYIRGRCVVGRSIFSRSRVVGALRARQASVKTSFEDALKRVFVFVPHGNGGAGALAHASLLVDQRDPGGAVMVALAMASVSPARPRGVSRKWGRLYVVIEYVYHEVIGVCSWRGLLRRSGAMYIFLLRIFDLHSLGEELFHIF